MTSATPAEFTVRTVEELTIEDESSFRHVGLYADLKEALRRAKYRFRVLPRGASTRWDRALLLNLTFWGNDGGDVLVDDQLPADVVAHAAWHHLAAKAFATSGARASADALFFGEAIASAFDLYLVGRLLGHSPESTFLESQVPAMAEAAYDAGLTESEFETLLGGISSDPERAFEDLRQLLLDASTSLLSCRTVEEGLVALVNLEGHRFASLLHRYELSNWVLYARAYAPGAHAPDARVRQADRALRACVEPLDWLASTWIAPALGGPGIRSC